MGKLEVKINKSADNLALDFVGSIDEDTDFSKYNLSGAKQISLNLDGIKAINSCGIREWIKWLGTASSAKVILDKCPKVIVDQINMVDGFLPANAKVESFYVPYFHEDSGSEKNVLFKSGQEFADGQVKPPAEVKDPSGNVLEIDVMESKYFKFITKK